MQIANGTADVTTYFVLRDSTNHAPKTDVTVTDIDLYYVEQGAAMAAKVDATALDAADSAHADNKAFHVGQGLYRIDWPDAAFDGGVGKVVNLAVVCSGVDTTFLEVELVGVAQTGDSYARLGAPAGASVSADIAAIEAQTDDIGAAGAGLSAIPWPAAWDAEVQSEVTDALNAYDPPTDTEMDAAFAALATEAEIADAVWDEASADHVAAGSTGKVISDVLTDTAEIGTAGAGLTNINLPNQTMDITGSLSGSVGSVAAGGITAASIATGAIDADALAADAVDEILDEVVEGAYTMRQLLQLMSAALFGKASGGGTATVTFRDTGDSADRIVATVDANGNRTAVVLTV